MTGKGFAGCATLAELVAYLQQRFSRADKYKSKRVEINILVMCFAYTKWFVGHVNAACAYKHAWAWNRHGISTGWAWAGH